MRRTIYRYIDEAKMTSATGIAIGKRDGEKLYIYDVMLTPNPESVQSDIKQV